MLDKVDLSLELSRKEYKARLPAVGARLTLLQRSCWESKIPVIVLFEGWDASGKGTSINLLTQQFDPRGFRIHPIKGATDLEKQMPWLWRFWLRLPNYGEIAIFDRSWYGRVMVERVEKLIPPAAWREAYQDILEFERTLSDEGYVIVKLFLHISKAEQKRRFKNLEMDKLQNWRVTHEDWGHHRKYEDYLVSIEEMLGRTESEWAPWVIVEATDRYWTRMKILETVSRRMEEALLNHGKSLPPPVDEQAVEEAKDEEETMLSKIDANQFLTREDYNRKLGPLQLSFQSLAHELYERRRALIVVFEGWDAAGKGGAIRRLTEQLDARGYEVSPIGAPEGEDRTHHYLYRFWRRLKPAEEKQVQIFDRSWYGRVMVERVEGFCPEESWKRAYREINDFERQLASNGMILVKFWLHITPEEQLARFEARQTSQSKAWKLNEEDWRNRAKWSLYEKAVEEMLLRTSTLVAPWTVVEANDKHYSRIKVLKTVVDTLDQELSRVPDGKKKDKGN